MHRTTAVAAGAACAAALLAGCGGGGGGRSSSQVAAKVNQEELSIHQINFRLQRQAGLKPEQAEAAGRQTLERLIDEELAVQKAMELKLDRDPKVVQAIEAARREIIARVYQEKTADAASRPGPEDIRRYYDSNPALFKERRVYTLQEIAIEVEPVKVEELKTRLQSAKTTAEFVEYLKVSNLRFVANQAVRAAEQLPLASLPSLARMKDGEAVLQPTAAGAQVVTVLSSRAASVEETKARPVIEQFLWNENKRRMVHNDMKSLREAAKIEYVGKYADAADQSGATASAPR